MDTYSIRPLTTQLHVYNHTYNIETESDGNGQILRRLLHMYMCTYTDEADCQGGVPYFIFVADAADNVRGEILCHVEKF